MHLFTTFKILYKIQYFDTLYTFIKKKKKKKKKYLYILIKKIK